MGHPVVDRAANKQQRVMIKVWCLALLVGCFGVIQASEVETRSAPLENENQDNHAEIQQMIDMMKNYKNRLFLANHGKRSVVAPLEEESAEEDYLTSEEMKEFKFSTAPNSFFFLPMPIGRSSGFYKRAGNNRIQPLSRPNGFMFPVGRRAFGMDKRSAGQKMLRNPNGFNFPMGKRYYVSNPNGFNFPMSGKRAAPELDLDGNFYGNRGKRRNKFLLTYFNRYRYLDSTLCLIENQTHEIHFCFRNL